ncbi:uncharacterized protein L201_001405 [Kwoniella dendrophila CBS 6074]|uniref:Kinetochore protein Spc24 n=1 Tax=Kwoniella dendrophila CBS 6074 TaxID=1295534 RepID=A0AAX4JNT1_9TREE
MSSFSNSSSTAFSDISTSTLRSLTNDLAEQIIHNTSIRLTREIGDQLINLNENSINQLSIEKDQTSNDKDNDEDPFKKEYQRLISERNWSLIYPEIESDLTDQIKSKLYLVYSNTNIENDGSNVGTSTRPVNLDELHMKIDINSNRYVTKRKSFWSGFKTSSSTSRNRLDPNTINFKIISNSTDGLQCESDRSIASISLGDYFDKPDMINQSKFRFKTGN